MTTTPTEKVLLKNFLLSPAPLPAIISLKEFTKLFPTSQQASPAIRAIYRRLQAQRLRLTDLVDEIIVNEAKRGETQSRAISRAKWEDLQENIAEDDEILIEETLLGPLSNLPGRLPHTLNSILYELKQAKEAIEHELLRLEQDELKELEEIKNAVGSLSDLKYGRMANPQLRHQVIEGCSRLEKMCEM